MNRLYFLSLFSIVFLLGCPNVDPTKFYKEIVSSRGEYKVVGLFDAIATDSNNKVHISHESDDLELLYTTNDSGNWITTIIDNKGIEIGKYSSIAVDSSNKVHITYFESTDYEQLGEGTLIYGNLKYATNEGGSWEVSVLDTGTGMTPRIYVDGNDKVHIVHTKLGVADLNSLLDLKYTTRKSGIWETITINSGVVKGTDASIAVDSNGKIHISCRNEQGAGTSPEGGVGGLRYITNESGQWTWYDVDTISTAGNDGDITLDNNEKVHISYLDKNGGLKYATNKSGIWETHVLDSTENVGWNTSIKADSNNKIHISYSDPGLAIDPPGNGYLKYATNATENDSWNISIVDTENAGYTTGIEISKNNHVHIAYYVFDAPIVKGELKYAVKLISSISE